MAWRRLPAALAALDLNLAPLALDDPFSAAKSELKFFEAGATGVPTIASPTAAFRAAITPGIDGLLAEGEEAWLGALRHLVDDRAERRGMGRAARATVVERYRVEHRGDAMEEAHRRLSARRRGEAPKPPGTVRPLSHQDSRPDLATLPVLTDLPGLASHPMGADYVLEERAASHRASVVVEGRWLAAWLRARGSTVVGTRSPAFDPRVFHPGLAAPERPLLIACDLGASDDPSTRSLAVGALAAARAADPALEVLLFRSAEGRTVAEGAVAPDPAWRAPQRDEASTPPDLPELESFTWAGVLDDSDRARVLREAAVLLDTRCVNPLPRLAEALACGCPVVSCDVAPLPWREGLGAWTTLAPPQADALGARLVSLARDAAERERRSRAGLALSERWARLGPPEITRSGRRHGGRWDLLQAHTERLGPPLTPGTALEQSFVPRADGLSHIGFRLAWPEDGAPRGELKLELDPVPSAPLARFPTGPLTGGPVRPLAADGLDAWTWFPAHVDLPSAGQPFTARLTWQPDPDSGDGSQHPPAPHVIGADTFPHGRTRWQGEVVGWTPAFATQHRSRLLTTDAEPARSDALPPPSLVPGRRPHARARLDHRCGPRSRRRDGVEPPLPHRGGARALGPPSARHGRSAMAGRRVGSAQAVGHVASLRPSGPGQGGAELPALAAPVGERARHRHAPRGLRLGRVCKTLFGCARSLNALAALGSAAQSNVTTPGRPASASLRSSASCPPPTWTSTR